MFCIVFLLSLSLACRRPGCYPAADLA